MSAPKRQRVSKARKGPDPGTPSLDRLVDSPLPFLVGFHQDGSIHVAASTWRTPTAPRAR